MRTRVLPLIIASIVSISVLSWGREIPSNASEEEDINKLIQTATTPEDHMKIADYHQKQAEKMKDQASIHVTMSKAYESKGKPYSAGIANHCLKLSNDYTKAAGEYEAMAKELHTF
jgi:hypothetical protein